MLLRISRQEYMETKKNFIGCILQLQPVDGVFSLLAGWRKNKEFFRIRYLMALVNQEREFCRMCMRRERVDFNVNEMPAFLGGQSPDSVFESLWLRIRFKQCQCAPVDDFCRASQRYRFKIFVE
jgi:hypothetical protein